MFPQFATRKQRLNFWGGAALVALVLAFGAWHDLRTPERRAALNASSGNTAAETRDKVEMLARGMCQDSVLFHTLQRANLGWGASARMKNGDFIIKQPFTINTLAGKRQFEARCTLHSNGTFDVLMQD